MELKRFYRDKTFLYF